MDSTHPFTPSDPEYEDIGTLGENFIEHICRLAFIEDFVFRRPKYRRGRQEKELCDILVLFDDACVLIEVKTANPSAHRGWSPTDEVQWAQSQTLAARRQLEGAFRALCKELVPSAQNDFQGLVNLRTNPPSRFFAIAAIDCPSLAQYGHLEGFAFGEQTCHFLHLSFNELSTLLQELASLPDLMDYLDFRKRFLVRNTFHGCRELDLLAGFKTRFPDLEASLRAGDRIMLGDDLWTEYSQMSRRRMRDKERWPGELYDRIIKDMRGGVPVDDSTSFPLSPTPRGHTMLPGALFVATRLNSLRRVERVEIGNKLIEKSKLCEAGPRGRFFARQAHNGWMYLFYVSNEERHARRKMLKNLTELAQIHNGFRRAVGIAMNSFTKPGISMAIDSMAIELPNNFDFSTVAAEDRELAARVFKPPVVAELQEYKPWKSEKAGFN